MSHRLKTLTTTALLGLTLTLTTPTPTSALTMADELCQNLGALTYEAARARDAGLSLAHMLRIAAQTPPPASLLGQAFAEVVRAHIRQAYASPRRTPAQLRQDREAACRHPQD